MNSHDEPVHQIEPVLEADRRVRGAELAVVVPTFNERENVRELTERLDAALRPYRWEVIYVDDNSPDGTAELVREIGRDDHRIRCVQRIGRRGLSSACIEGMLASTAPYVAVIDGDLQHDERLIPQMLETLKRGEADIVIGTRYATGGGVGDWDRSRVSISRLATRLSRLVIKSRLSDPMSGFFMLRREWMEDALPRLSGIGVKILLDLFASAKQQPRVVELPYEFRARARGDSKLDSHAVWDYLMLLLDKRVGRIVPIRFVSFGIVGGVGIIVHFLFLAVMFNRFDAPFNVSQAIATVAAMTSNYALNNALTYRDMKLRGWRWLHGWLSFVLACSIGAVANVGIASYLFEMDTQWPLAALAGILMGAVWNYAVTMTYTWRDSDVT